VSSQDVCLTIEWRLISPEDRMVYVYERSKNESPSRDHVYRGRAEMTEDPLTTKDLSLTLKDLHLTDSGVYTCTVYNKDGHMLLQRVVTLSVRGECNKASVLLPFKITDLLQDIKVEWKHQNIIVHVYQNSQNQSLLMDEDYKGRTEMNEEPLKNKDLSLTLKGLQLSDRGGYTCTVYNKDGSILLQKVVTLSVRGECNSCLQRWWR
uniref:Ig-like domain-containing protein n=1 Tax=Oreochromis aureus TaxID=47969 RepID=A0A668UX39_OREAU